MSVPTYLQSRACAFCEYFDGGGLESVLLAIKAGSPITGDCHNRRAPRWQTTSHDTCPVFVEDPGVREAVAREAARVDPLSRPLAEGGPGEERGKR